MNAQLLTDQEKARRMAVRNFLLIATTEELYKELEISNGRGDLLRARCIQELIHEAEQEAAEREMR